MFTKSLLTGAAALALLPSAALAQTAGTLNDEITVTGLRAVAPADVTSSVTVLTQADLDIRNAPYIVDQLRAVPGAAISRNGAFGSLTQIRLRGSEGNHTLVLLNGIEVSNPVTGETDFGILSGLQASRIEVARGEQSGLYGSDAIGGVVSITTGGEGLTASAEAGSFGTKRAQLGVSTGSDAGKFNFAVSGFSTDGVDTSGSDGNEDGAFAASVMTGGEIVLPGDWTLGGLVSFRNSQVDFDNDTDFDGFLNDTDTDSTAEQLISGVTLQGQTGAVDHNLRASYTDVSIVSNSAGAFNNETGGERTKLSYSPSYAVQTEGADIVVSGLVDWESESYERIDTQTAFGDPNQSQSFDTIGFAIDSRAAIGALALSGSVRHDNNDGRFDDATTWRIGSAYNFAGGGKIRVSAGTGVKNPGFTELFGFAPANFIGNPNLKPETSASREIGYDHDFGSVQTSATYFQAELENEIFTNFDVFPFTAENRAGDSERSGVELSARWAAKENLTFTGSVSAIKSENDSGVDEVRVPEATGSASVNWRSLSRDGLTAGLALDYVGEQSDTFFPPFPTPSQRVTLDSYVLVSANLAYPISDEFALTLRGENLLDEAATDVFSYNNPGAGVFFGFKLR